jgi:hypothetical protein
MAPTPPPDGAAQHRPSFFADLLEPARNHLQNTHDAFQLTPDRLLKITDHFVSDFGLGLGEYSQAMAMM